MTIRNKDTATVYQELPDWAQRAWQKMLAQIQEFRPDVVVLTARKMPRVVEVLRTHLGEHAIVISDLAIPFSSDCLADARVAILDDVVNVGSTLEHIAELVQQRSPSAIRLFSLAARTSNGVKTSREIIFGHPAELTEKEYVSYVRTVPAVISHICKPYDLVFPVLQARYQIPFRSATDVVGFLERKFEVQNVRVIPTPYANSPIRRVSLLLSTENTQPHIKLRLFFNDATGSCCIVPMVIPHCIEEGNMPVRLPWVLGVRNRLKEALPSESAVSSEALSSILLFTSSLDWFFSGEISDYFDSFLQFEKDPFSIPDAKAVFGLKVEGILAEMLPEMSNYKELVSPNETKTQDFAELGNSPFLENFQTDSLVENAVKILKQNGLPSSNHGIDCYGYLLALMEALSKLVGGERPNEYKAVWPYTLEEINKNPYLRLRIGPTFTDIVAICARMYELMTNLHSTPVNLAKTLSVTLDALIDQGAIVPTFANYEGKIFRIYRRGEGPGQDVCDKVLFAIATQDKPFSVTRIAKILATLSHSQEYHKLLESSARTRGLVGGVPKTVVGAEPDNIATYIRNTGQLKAIEK